MAQEIKYSEDFTGADGSLPANWSKVELGTDIGIQNNKLDLNNAGNFDGDGLAWQDETGGYTFFKNADWELLFDTSITGLDDDTKEIRFTLDGEDQAISGFRFRWTGSSCRLLVARGVETEVEITISSYPTKIRFRNISGILFLDYDRGYGDGYEFGGGPAFSTELRPNIPHHFGVYLTSSNWQGSTSELRVTLDNYIVLGDVIIISDFWHNQTLQTEKDNLPGEGSLVKLSTVKIIRSSYVPPTEATGPMSSVSSGINYVCEKVV